MKVMIVDDENVTSTYLETMLNKRGYEIDRAENGRIALDKIRSAPPDIIISDIMMPELDGFELYSSLQHSEDTAEIPFIFLSKKDDPKDQLKGLRMGAEEYLVKPFKPEDVISAIERAMEKCCQLKDLKGETDIGGNLSKIGLNEIVQLIGINEKSGELVLTSSSGRMLGTIYIEEGRVVDAVSGCLEGKEAFYDLMAHSEGSFRFCIRNVSRKKRIGQQNINLLLEATRLGDEAKDLESRVSSMDAKMTVLNTEMPKDLSVRVPAEALAHILAMIRQDKTIREVIDNAGLSRLRSAAVIGDLIRHSVIVEKTGAAQPSGPQTAIQQASARVRGNLVNRLRSLEGSAYTGMVDIQGRSKPAAIYVDQGRIINAEHGSATGRKALFRIFSERGGSCYNREMPAGVDRIIDTSLDELIADADTEIAWRRRLKLDFSNIRIIISDKGREAFKVMAEDPVKSPLIEIVTKHGLMQDVIEASPYPDFETCQILDELKANGLLMFRKTNAN